MAIAGIIIGSIPTVFFTFAIFFVFLKGSDFGEKIFLLVYFGAFAAVVLAIVVMSKIKLKKYKNYNWYSPLTVGIILAYATRWSGLVPKSPAAFTFTTVVGMWIGIGAVWLLSLQERREERG